MATITIDGKEYDTDDLSEEAIAQLQSIRFVDQELARVVANTAALQTARNAYARALQEILGTVEGGEDPVVDLPDDLSFD